MHEAKEAARSLVSALEDGHASASQVIMKAQKLARLLRDSDAQAWLHFEANGYPGTSSEVKIGTCAKYALRFAPDGRTSTTASLPALEAHMHATEAALQKIEPLTLSAPVKDYFVAGATQQVLAGIETTNTARRNAYVTAAANYNRLRDCIHRYAVDTLISLEFGDVAESIFESARTQVDRFVRDRVPRGAEQLLAASERIRDDNSEGRSAALTACRRFLMSLADAVYPPTKEPYVGRDGKPRQVGHDQYKNRLLAFIDRELASRTTLALIESHVEHLASRLDALNENASKGVHAHVTVEETQLTLIETYVLAAEIARLAQATAPKVAHVLPQEADEPTEV